jgi:hypothetical protein
VTYSTILLCFILREGGKGDSERERERRGESGDSKREIDRERETERERQTEREYK